MPRPVTPIVSATAPSPDPRVGLKAGWWDAGEAAWNMNMVSTTPPTGKSLGATHLTLGVPPDVQGPAVIERLLEAKRVLAAEVGS